MDNNVIYETITSFGGPASVKMSSSEYMKLQRFYTNFTNALSELDKMIVAEKDNLNKNEADLNMNDTNVRSFDTSITNNEIVMDDKNKELSSRKYQYELAVKRNEHRRQMVLMLAGLNTLGLMIYYFMSK
jgi:23S rRNA pseudoU1915 N3-methylase RlmH